MERERKRNERKILKLKGRSTKSELVLFAIHTRVPGYILLVFFFFFRFLVGGRRSDGRVERKLHNNGVLLFYICFSCSSSFLSYELVGSDGRVEARNISERKQDNGDTSNKQHQQHQHQQ